MDAAVYRKLRKFITKPRQFMEDAWLNRQFQNAAQARNELDTAHALFKTGQLGEAKAQIEQQAAPLYLGHLLLAKIALFEKQYAEAEQHAFQVMQLISPYCEEFKQAFFLHQEALRWQHQHDAALAMLVNMPFKDQQARFYRALRLACLGANQPATFESYLIALNPSHKAWFRARNHYLMLLRDLGREARALAEAQAFMQQVLQQPQQNKSVKPSVAKLRSSAATQVWQGRAALALGHLKAALAQHDLECFLVSGTLLGCIREGTILGHDSDIDVGIMPDISMKQLRDALAGSCFKFQEVYSENTLYLAHPNGVHIDVFRHYEIEGKLYHGGIKCQWWNTPFDLKATTFLGEQYLIPADPATYLTENYGDWQTPVTDFATFLDTPNMEINYPINMALYYAAQAVAAYRERQVEKSTRYQRAFDELAGRITKETRLQSEG